MIKIENFRIERTLYLQDRFHKYEAIDQRSNMRCIVYAFQQTKLQNKEIVWNDFHIAINSLEKALGENLLEADILEDLYYFSIKSPEDIEDVATLKKGTFTEIQRFYMWMKIMNKMADLHAQGITHGHLNEKNTYFSNVEPSHLYLQDCLLWRFYQIFLLELPMDCYNSSHTRGRNYRYEIDDYYSLGIILWDLLYPNNAYPKSEFDLQKLSDIDEHIYKIFYYLIFHPEGVNLATLHEVAVQFTESHFEKSVLSIQWHENYSNEFLESDQSIFDWEQKFLRDVQDECYLFTTYQKIKNHTVLHAIGKENEWKLHVVDNKETILCDLVPMAVQELTFPERELLKEKGKRYLGKWEFKSIRKMQNFKLIQHVKTHSIEKQAHKKVKLHSRVLLDQWNNVLTLQQSLLYQNNQTIPYKSYILEANAQLLLDIGEATISNLEVGAEIATIIDDIELVIGTLIEQGTDYLCIQLTKGFDITILPSSGEIYEFVKRKSMLLRRQQKILSEFIHGKVANSKVREAIVHPKKIQGKEITFDQTFQTLNHNQEQSLSIAFGANPLFLLQGPPGTGKTTWITELILQIYHRNPYARILITSQSNVAIDHAFEKSLTILQKYSSKFKEMPTAIRIGLEEKTSDFSKQWSFHKVLDKWVEELEERAFENIMNISQQHMYNDPQRYMRLMSLFDDWKDEFHKSDEMKNIYLQQKPLLVGATCMGSYSFHQWKQKFDWVIIDEAAKSTVPETIIPLSLGEKIILVGDHKQLAPIVHLEEDYNTNRHHSALQKELQRSLFEDLFNEMTDGKGTLQTQYRMNPVIANIVSELFYPEYPLVTGKETGKPINDESPVNWIATDHHSDCLEQSYKTSYYNIAEIQVIQYHLIALNAKCSEKKSVAIITGYAAQREKIRDAIHSIDLPNLLIEVDTVDAFQGKEADIVYYSLVRHNVEGNFGFLGDERRTNVMMSRAKEHLYIVGHCGQIQHLNPSHILSKLLTSLRKQSNFTMINWEEVMK